MATILGSYEVTSNQMRSDRLICTNKKTQEQVYVKVFYLDDEQSNERFKHQCCITVQLRNLPGVQQAIKAVTENKIGYIIYQFNPDTRSMNNNTLSPSEIPRSFYKVCKAIESCHNRGVTHGDIRPESILSYHDGILRVFLVGNFDCAHSTRYPSSTISSGRLYYTAPEVFKKQQFDPEKADIWSLGVTLHFLLTKKLPFSSAEDYLRGRHCIKKIAMSTEAEDLIRRMITFDPQARLNMKQILEHKFFSSSFISSGAVDQFWSTQPNLRSRGTSAPLLRAAPSELIAARRQNATL